MKRVLFIFTLCGFLFSCQPERMYRLEEPTIAMDTRDSLIGRWDMQYSFILTYSDSTYSTVIDSFFYGAWGPFAFLRLNDDSTHRQYLSESVAPPIYGNGASGMWRYEAGLRRIWVSHEIYSVDTGWTNTLPHPPPNHLMPIYWINHLGSDSLALYIQGRRDIPPTRYTRTFDIFKRRK